MMAETPPFDDNMLYSDWHAVATIQLGELLEVGFIDWNDGSWDFPSVQVVPKGRTEKVDLDGWKERIRSMIEKRYYWREISYPIAGQWKHRLLYRIEHELVPKYEPVYQMLVDGVDWFADWNEYGKKREILSGYPETLLSGNSDYLESGEDMEFETVHDGPQLDKLLQFMREFEAIDARFVDELDGLFLKLTSVSTGYF